MRMLASMRWAMITTSSEEPMSAMGGADEPLWHDGGVSVFYTSATTSAYRCAIMIRARMFAMVDTQPMAAQPQRRSFASFKT